jgi:alanine racemase
MAAALANNVTLTVCDQKNIYELQKRSKQHQVVTPVHLKIDTGMGRIGVTPADAPAMAAYIEKECTNLYFEGIFTHLPVSDTETSEFTINQVQLFQQTVSEIQQAIGREVDLVHCANSGAVLGHPKAWFDMVRPGIMIYGFYPDRQTPHSIELKPGLSFYTRVSFIKKVSAGTSIGYGRTWIASEDSFVATIPVGYADGFNRLFSNSGRVLIHGRSYPVVGRVCMDQCMINLGRDTNIRVGDEVVLIGKSGKLKIDGEEWAEKLNTITYEVTCQINSRVPRNFDTFTHEE